MRVKESETHMPSRPNDDCLHLALTAEMASRINGKAMEYGLPRLQLVRMILQQWLNANPLPPKVDSIDIAKELRAGL